MGRAILIAVLLFAVPIGVYIVWRVFLSPEERRRPVHELELDSFPWPWLILAGTLCAMAGLALFIDFDQGQSGDVYERPRMVDGKVVPGHFRERGKGEQAGDGQ